MLTKARGVSRNSIRMNAVIGVLVVLVLASTTPTIAGDGWSDDATSADATDGEYAQGELLIKFKDGASDADKKTAKDAIKGKVTKTFKNIGVEHLELDDDMDVDKALKELQKKKYADIVEFAEPNYFFYAHGTPTASYRGQLWGMHNLGQFGGTSDADIDALEVWISGHTDASNVVVGVIDTGIDYNNADLAGNIWQNAGETGTDGDGKDKKSNGIDDDGNGFIDDHRGWDFYNDDNDPMDDNGHGTHVSGTIGGDGDNGVGVAGVCWDVQLMPLKFLNAGGRGSTDDAIEAIDYAASFQDGNGDNIVRITSNSWGGGRKSKTLERSIESSGALFIASAGNSGRSSLQYPAGYSCDNIISVAATDHNDGLASFSNYGSNWVDLGAPGVNVLSCVLGGEYDWFQGTSMSTPHVTGVAALLMENNPSWSLDAVKSRIMDTGDALSSLDGMTVSGKRLNAMAALGASALPSDSTAPSTVTDLALSDETYSSMKLTWTPPGDDGATGIAWLYDIRYSTSTIDGSNWDSATQVELEPGPIEYVASEGTTQSLVVDGLRDGTTYYFAMRTYDEAGNLAALSNVGSLKTQTSTWATYPLNNEGAAGRHSFAYDNNGVPAIVYKDSSMDPRDLYYARMDRSDNTWDVTKVTTCDGGGVDVAFDDSNHPGIVYYSDDEVYAAVWDGTSWDIDQIEPRKAYNDYCSIAFSGSYFGVTYYVGGRNGGLMYATYDGSSWTKETVDKGAGARYSALAYDSSGNPGIAYSDNNYGGDYLIDSMMYAEWDSTSSSWSIDEVESGTIGYGVFCDLAFGPDDNPRLVHSNTESGIRYLEWDTDLNPPDWSLSVIVTGYGGYTGVEVTSAGVPYVSYHRPGGDVYVAYHDGSSWTIEPIALGITAGRGIFIDYHDDGSGTEVVGVHYVDSQKAQFAEKTL